MPARIVVFGATGYTGRLTSERLVAQGERPLLAGRSEERLTELAERLGGLEWRVADVDRPNTVFSLVERGDVVVSTVGPFAKWGDPAVRAAIAAPAVYLDSTGEPQFIRRVFEAFGPAAAGAGATLMTAMGYDFVPGALAGALALEDAARGEAEGAAGEASAGGEASGRDRKAAGRGRAVRVDIGYYALGAGPGSLSRGTRASLVGAALGGGFAFRDGALRTVRPAERVRDFKVRGKLRPAISVGGAEHFGLPAAYPRLAEVNVYLGWLGPLARVAQAASLGGSVVGKIPGVAAVARAGGEQLMAKGTGPAAGTTPGGLSWIAATAYDAAGAKLAEVHLSGDDAYAFTAGCLAWAARRAAHAGVEATGAVGPVEAFGLEALLSGCEEAGLRREPGPA